MIRVMGQRQGAISAQISLGRMLRKKPYIVPIPGSRKTERMIENAGVVDICLAADEAASLDYALDMLPMSAVLVEHNKPEVFRKALYPLIPFSPSTTPARLYQ